MPPQRQASAPKQFRAHLHNALCNPSPLLPNLIKEARSNASGLESYLEETSAQVNCTKYSVPTAKVLFFQILARACSTGEADPSIIDAYSEFQNAKGGKRKGKREFLLTNRMTKEYRDNTDEAIYSNKDEVPEIHLKKLRTAYPPRGKWVCEDSNIKEKWHDYLLYGVQPDSRLPRHAPMILDETRLQLVVNEDDSCVVRDSKTSEIVLIVLRNVSDPKTLDNLANIVEDTVTIRRDIRKEDSGTLVMIGWSAGARSKPSFHWVRNILRKTSASRLDALNNQDCSAFAYFWNLLKHRVPSEVKDDFQHFMEETGLPRMNPESDLNNVGGSAKGSYTLWVGEEEFEFHDVELAPPAGVMGQNYARAMHYENQPHKFAVSFTVERNGDLEDGGHFYVGAYGIKVNVTPNTMIVWQPRHIHGTSLPNTDPGDKNPIFTQRGMSFVTSQRLPRVWNKYKEAIAKEGCDVDKEAREAACELWGKESERDEIFD